MANPSAAPQRIYIDMDFVQGTQNATSRLAYAVASGDAIYNAAQVTQAVQDVLTTYFLPLMSAQAKLLSLTAVGYGDGAFLAETKYVNLVGTSVGQVLPPFCVYSFVKFPDNTDIGGPVPDPFRIGGWRMSGVPEANSENGELPTSVRTDCDVFAEQMRVITPASSVSGTGDLQMFMYRPPLVVGGPAAATAFVIDTQVRQLVTSQVSRKA